MLGVNTDGWISWLGHLDPRPGVARLSTWLREDVAGLPTPIHSVGRLVDDASSGILISLLEADADVLVVAELPGCRPQDVELSMTGYRHLRITAAPPPIAVLPEGQWELHERQTGPRSRTVSLPVEADPDSADAFCRDGVLTVRFRRRVAAQTRTLRPLAVSVSTEKT